MKKFNRFIMIMSVILLTALVCNIVMILDMKAAIKTSQSIQEWLGMAVAGIIIAAGLFHLIGLINLFVQMKKANNDRMIRAAAFVTGIFSLFLLTVDVIMMRDIGNEYAAGHNISGEWNIIFAGHGIHILFALLMLTNCISVNKRMNGRPISALKDEVFFLTVHQIGMISAIYGFICLILVSCFGIPEQFQDGLLFMFCIVILIPYAISVIYWFLTKRKQKIVDWYDEKQFADICRGALGTLVLTTLATIVFYILVSCGSIAIKTTAWFPSMIFITLLVFSCSSLYLSKKG